MLYPIRIHEGAGEFSHSSRGVVDKILINQKSEISLLKLYPKYKVF